MRVASPGVVDAILIVDDHRGGEALDASTLVLYVGDLAVDLVVGDVIAANSLGAGLFVAGGVLGVPRLLGGRRVGLSVVNRRRGGGRGAVAQGTRDAAGQIALAIDVQARLVTAHGGLVRGLIGAVALLGLFTLGEVDLSGDLRVHVGRPTSGARMSSIRRW